MTAESPILLITLMTPQQAEKTDASLLFQCRMRSANKIYIMNQTSGAGELQAEVN